MKVLVCVFRVIYHESFVSFTLKHFLQEAVKFEKNIK